MASALTTPMRATSDGRAMGKRFVKYYKSELTEIIKGLVGEDKKVSLKAVLTKVRPIVRKSILTPDEVEEGEKGKIKKDAFRVAFGMSENEANLYRAEIQKEIIKLIESLGFVVEYDLSAPKEVAVEVVGSGNVFGIPEPTEEELIEAVFEGRRFGRRFRAMRIENGDLEDRERLTELLLLDIPDHLLTIDEMNFVLSNVIEMSDTGLLDTLVEELGDDDDDDDDDRRTLSDVSSEEMAGEGRAGKKVVGRGNIFGRRRVQVAPAPPTEPELTGRLASSRTTSEVSEVEERTPRSVAPTRTRRSTTRSRVSSIARPEETRMEEPAQPRPRLQSVFPPAGASQPPTPRGARRTESLEDVSEAVSVPASPRRQRAMAVGETPTPSSSRQSSSRRPRAMAVGETPTPSSSRQSSVARTPRAVATLRTRPYPASAPAGRERTSSSSGYETYPSSSIEEDIPRSVGERPLEEYGARESPRTPSTTEGRLTARGLGREYGRAMMEKDEEFKRIVGGGFLDFFKKGLADIVPKVVGAVAKQVMTDPTKLSVAGVARPFVGKVVAPVVGATMGTKGKVAQKLLEGLTSDATRDAIAKKISGKGESMEGGAGYADPKKYGKTPKGGAVAGGAVAGGAVMKKKRKPSAHILERSRLIKKLMNEEGLSMIEASKAVKARGLM